jgi:hypothetical protein
MPVKTEYIWKLYGTNWVRLKAPRHLTIHTIKSFELLLGRTDLNEARIMFDSGINQFVGSEEYVRGIASTSEKSYYVNEKQSIFNPRQIRMFKRLAKRLNKAEQGAQATFCLQKK